MSAARYIGYLAIWLFASPAVAGDLPDPARTPGALNPAVTQASIHATVCVKGWTATVRPPKAFTDALKRKQLRDWRYADRLLAHYEEDHLVSLVLGGHPTDARNLWPQLWAAKCGALEKDALELTLARRLCAGSVTLADAQHAIAQDWIAAYRKFVGPLVCQ